MTWARNHGDRNSISSLDTRRAKKITKVCPDCGTGIPNIKKRCAPCYSVKLQARAAAASKQRHSAKMAQKSGAA
jgi:hypothetical protein